MDDDDLLDLYRRASDWTLGKVAVASDHLDAVTGCEGWDVRTLMNHMLETQRFFVASARGEDSTPPGAEPPDLLGRVPLADFTRSRDEALRTFGKEGVVERTGRSLGIAFSDQLLHGWDLARATGQDATMPEGLAEAAYQQIHGRFTEEQRHGVFRPELPVSPDATPQERLLAYTGRPPSG